MDIVFDIFGDITQTFKNIMKKMGYVNVLLMVGTLFLLWLLITYYVLKWFKLNIYDCEMIYYKKYDEETKQVLKKYGSMPIHKLYLIRNDVSTLSLLFANFISFFMYTKVIKRVFPRHVYVVVEYKMKNREIKRIVIEKWNKLVIKENYCVYDTQIEKKLKIKSGKYTLNGILEQTKVRMGEKKYYNWHYINNNCQNMTKELLITIKNDTKKNLDFIIQEQLSDVTALWPEFSVHLMNVIITMYCMVEETCDDVGNYVRWRLNDMYERY